MDIENIIKKIPQPFRDMSYSVEEVGSKTFLSYSDGTKIQLMGRYIKILPVDGEESIIQIEEPNEVIPKDQNKIIEGGNNMDQINSDLMAEMEDIIGSSEQAVGAPVDITSQNLTKSEVFTGDGLLSPVGATPVQEVGRVKASLSVETNTDLEFIRKYNTKHGRLVCFVTNTDARAEVTASKTYIKLEEGESTDPLIKFQLKDGHDPAVLASYLKQEQDRIDRAKDKDKKNNPKLEVNKIKKDDIFATKRVLKIVDKAPTGIAGVILKVPQESYVETAILQANSLKPVVSKLKSSEFKESDCIVVALGKKDFATNAVTIFSQGRIYESLLEEGWEKNTSASYDGLSKPAITVKVRKAPPKPSDEKNTDATSKAQDVFRMSMSSNVRKKIISTVNYIPLSVFKLYDVDVTKPIPQDIQAKLIENEINPKMGTDSKGIVGSAGKNAKSIVEHDKKDPVYNIFLEGKEKMPISVKPWYNPNGEDLKVISFAEKKDSNTQTGKKVAEKIMFPKDPDFPLDRVLDSKPGVTAEHLKEIQSLNRRSNVNAQAQQALKEYQEISAILISGAGGLDLGDFSSPTTVQNNREQFEANFS